MRVHTLVDFDNIRRGSFETRTDVEDLVTVIGDLAERLVASTPDSGIDEVVVRLYGGWVERSGALTPRCQWLLSAAHALRTTRSGVRYLPSVALELAAHDGFRLAGTYRKIKGAPGQKMVDGMIMIDLVHYAQTERSHVYVISNDDDILPGILHASLVVATTWVRPSREKESPNDWALRQNGVDIVDIPTL